MADVLKQEIVVSVTLDRNSRTMYAQRYNPVETSFSESTHQRIVLATNMASPQEVDLSGVTSAPDVEVGDTLFLEADRALKVSVNDSGNVWPISANGAILLTGAISHVYLQNESTTNTVTVELVVTG